MKCSQLLEHLEYTCLQGSTDVKVTAVVNDSRKIEEGCLFLCIKGAAFDGHKFAAEAAEKGAAVLVVEDEVEVPDSVTVIKVDNTRYAMALISAAWFGYPAEELTTIAVTGTKGKTTTTYMVKSLLEEAGHKVGVIGTIEVVIGQEHIPVNNTAPESMTSTAISERWQRKTVTLLLWKRPLRDLSLTELLELCLITAYLRTFLQTISDRTSIRTLQNTFPARQSYLTSAAMVMRISMMSILQRLQRMRPARLRHLV